MRLVTPTVVSVIGTLCAADSVVRALLYLRTAGVPPAPARASRPAANLLVVIPARNEAESVRPTLTSAANDNVLLLLDGPDPIAESIARELNAQVIVKTPPGPTKAAALAWLAANHANLLDQYDAVLLLDVGSTLGDSFFEHFHWPEDADAVQAHLEGGQSGGADSERFAQTHLDAGRESLGWNVRLRGTGSALRTKTFLEIAPQLQTRVEDLEASLLLHRARIRMAPREAVVHDEKPESVADAGAQRARWLIGNYELLVRRAGTLRDAVAHRPLEGLAFIAEIFGKPLSLTIPIRIAAGAYLIAKGRVATGSLIVGSTLIDAALLAGRTSPRNALRLAASWLVAAALAPKAAVRWTRVERP